MNFLRMEVQRFVRQRGSTVLALAASVGVIVGGVSIAKATVKTVEEINEAENNIDISEERELTRREKLAIAAPNYIPSAMILGGTIICILGAEVLNNQKYRNLTAAYIALNNTFHKYRNKVIDIYGISTDEEVIHSIASDCIRPEKELETGCEWFYDEYSDIMFESNLNVIENGIRDFNGYLSGIYSVDINTLYEMWGHPGLPFYQYISHMDGWDGIKPELSKAVDDDGLEYWSINLNLPSTFVSRSLNYEWR